MKHINRCCHYEGKLNSSRTHNTQRLVNCLISFILISSSITVVVSGWTTTPTTLRYRRHALLGTTFHKLKQGQSDGHGISNGLISSAPLFGRLNKGELEVNETRVDPLTTRMNMKIDTNGAIEHNSSHSCCADESILRSLIADGVSKNFNLALTFGYIMAFLNVVDEEDKRKQFVTKEENDAVMNDRVSNEACEDSIIFYEHADKKKNGDDDKASVQSDIRDSFVFNKSYEIKSEISPSYYGNGERTSSPGEKLERKKKKNSGKNMSPLTNKIHPVNSGMITDASKILQNACRKNIYQKLTPLERIALACNGNLQRLFSSFYDAPVHVVVLWCEPRKLVDDKEDIIGYSCSANEQSVCNGGVDKRYWKDNLKVTSRKIIDGDDEELCLDSYVAVPNIPINQTHFTDKNASSNRQYDSAESSSLTGIPAVWDRCVEITVYDEIVCTAVSEVTVHSARCATMVQSGEIAIGQLFRYLNKLPTFDLLDVGTTTVKSSKGNGSALWRDYVLKCDEITCRIHEEFALNAWEIDANVSNDM